MHQVWACRSVPSVGSIAIINVRVPRVHFEFRFPCNFWVLQKRLRAEAVYCINLEFPIRRTKEKRQPAGETPPALRKMKLPLHILSRKGTLWPLHFFFSQPVTPKGSMKGTEVKLSTKAKQINFSNFLWSFWVWSCRVFVRLAFFSESFFVNS